MDLKRIYPLILIFKAKITLVTKNVRVGHFLFTYRVNIDISTRIFTLHRFYCNLHLASRTFSPQNLNKDKILKNIEVRIRLSDDNEWNTVLRKIEECELSDIGIGQALRKLLGQGNVRAYATQFGYFRNRQRPLSKRLIAGVAKILDIHEDLLRRINDKFADSQIVLGFDAKLKFREYIDSIPEECDTLDRFLVWLSTETERRRLLSQI